MLSCGSCRADKLLMITSSQTHDCKTHELVKTLILDAAGFVNGTNSGQQHDRGALFPVSALKACPSVPIPRPGNPFCGPLKANSSILEAKFQMRN